MNAVLQAPRIDCPVRCVIISKLLSLPSLACIQATGFLVNWEKPLLLRRRLKHEFA